MLPEDLGIQYRHRIDLISGVLLIESHRRENKGLPLGRHFGDFLFWIQRPLAFIRENAVFDDPIFL